MLASKVPSSGCRRPASHDCRLHSPATTSAKAIIRKTALGRLAHVGGEPNLPSLDGLCGATVSTVQSVTHHDICRASAQPRDKFEPKHARRLGGVSVVLCRACPLRRACACISFRPAQKKRFRWHPLMPRHTAPKARRKPITAGPSEVLADAASRAAFQEERERQGNLRGEVLPSPRYPAPALAHPSITRLPMLR